jgi:hypothetical protein
LVLLDEPEHVVLTIGFSLRILDSLREEISWSASMTVGSP